MPQVIMLTHASQVNKQRLDQELGQQRLDSQGSPSSSPTAAPSNEPMFNGKRIEDLNTAEYMNYLHS